ncbi:MAG: BACON domain-containing protein, partial [Lachnospiraceae bacterium]|nr:BACON domain-containing protein [Lachnospiraceae bacterium]
MMIKRINKKVIPLLLILCLIISLLPAFEGTAAYKMKLNETRATLASSVCTSIVILGENNQISTNETGTEAYIYYDVIDQYGNSIRSSVDIAWVFSDAAEQSVDISLGRITIKKSVDGSESYTYGTKIYLTSCDLESGVVVTGILNIGLQEVIDEADMVGFVNSKWNQSKIETSLPSNFKKDTWHLLYTAKNQYGNLLAAEKYDAGKITLLADNPLLVDTNFRAGDLYTINGIRYASVVVNPGSYADQNGKVEFSMISNKTGRISQKSFEVGGTYSPGETADTDSTYTSELDKITPKPPTLASPTPAPTPAMGVTFAPIVTDLTPTPTPTPTLGLEISASQTELSADAQGTFGSNKVDLTVTNSYSCTVSSSDSWLKVCKKNASASAGSTIWLSGDGKEWTESFYVFAYENTSVAPRTGEITITAEYGDKTVTEKVVVKQEAAKASLDVSTKNITANAKGKTSVTSVKVDTNKSGGFSVSNNGNSWLKVGSSSYSGSAASNVSFEAAGTFYIFVSENPSDEARTGQVIVTHEDGETTVTIEVVQEGTKAVLTVDSTSKTADDSGYFYNNAISVKTSRTGAFTAAVEDAGWLKISTERNPSFADGMDSITLDGDGYIYLVAEKNTGSERTATITISHAGGSLSETVTVTQMGKAASYLQVDRETAYFDEPSRALDGPVHISASEDTKWTVTSSESWI